MQGDIVGLLDSTGALVVEYKYDAWGKPIATTGNLADTLGKRNPFRYRGYVYDEETGLYYLRSRYYNPTVGRFVNADSCLSSRKRFLALNLFSYVENNTVNCIDSDGRSTNPFPFQSTPYDYIQGYNSNGELYERWYNEYGWPYMDRHWSDHGTPNIHTNPHDHFWDNPDPAQPPQNEHRILINDPPEKWPGQFDWEESHKKRKEQEKKQQKKSSNKTSDSKIGTAVAAVGVGIWWAIKFIGAVGTAFQTGDVNYFFSVVASP